MNQKIKNKNILLFDISPFIYMSFYAAQYMLSKSGHQDNINKLADISTTILISKFKKIFKLFENELITPFYCYDGRRPQRKINIIKEYKSNRINVMPDYVRSNLYDMIKTFKGYHVKNPNEEADDIIATIKQKCINIDKNDEFNYYIFSLDNDLLQLCDCRTKFYSPKGDGCFKGREYLEEKFKISNFKHIILHKICFGDASDNIEGIFKGKRRGPIIEKIKTCKKLSDFLNLDIIKDYNNNKKILGLFDSIRLYKNLELDIKLFNENFANLDKFDFFKPF